MRRNNLIYDIDLLRSLYTIGVDDDGIWRVFHAVSRGRSNGSGRQLKVGSLADTSITNKGYRQCILPQDKNGHQAKALAHIVIWMLFHQRSVPEDCDLDHENRNKLDNDPILNLRLLDHRSNSINCRRCADGRLNIEVHKNKPIGTKRFAARVVDPATGKRKSLGIYRTLAEAQVVADDFVTEFYGPTAPTNRSLGFLS